MSVRGDCMSCDRTWIYDSPPPDNKIRQCKDCHDKGYPSRLIYSMAVMPCELDIYDERAWTELRRRCR